MRIDERHTSELLGQSTRTMVLPSGLTVQMCRMPGFVTAYAMLTVGVGSIDIGYRVRGREVSLPAGVAHYLEHKMFDCPYGDAMQRFDALGASANAFTSFDKTAYYFSCTENFSKALEVLLDFVATPYFTGPSVRRERGIIAEELRMYRDSPEWMVTANLFAGHVPCSSHPGGYCRDGGIHRPHRCRPAAPLLRALLLPRQYGTFGRWVL